MAANLANGHPQRWRGLRALPWIAAAIVLLLPAVAMQLHVDGVDWSGSDFVVMGAMLLIACGSFELAARLAPNLAYLAAAAIGVGTGFVMVWANLAVGIVGDGMNTANLMFLAVVAVAIAGALVARLRARAMAVAMLAAAVAVGVAIAVSLAAFGATPLEAGLSLVFAAGWLVSAGLFRIAAAR